MADNSQKTSNKIVFLAFAISIFYWIYIGLISQTIIFHDSINYEFLGRVLKDKGFKEYLITGPNREPLYPFIISISMRLGEFLSLSYLTILKAIQILTLFVTQLLMWIILKKLRVNSYLSALTILYFGLSPAILNSSLRVYSEIMAYPILLLIVIIASCSWNAIKSQSKQNNMIICGLMLGLMFLLATSLKAMFEIIMPLFMFSFFVLLIKQKRQDLIKPTLIFILTCLCAYYVPIFAYKYANKKHNGHFVLTNRGPYALYGNTARRADGFTPERLKSAIVYATGHENCQAVFDDKACLYWHYSNSDNLGYLKEQEFYSQGLKAPEVNRQLMHESKALMLKNPIKHIVFMGIESLKMYFWEFKSMAYVVYPDWLANIYDHKTFTISVSFLTALLSFLALLYLIKQTCCHNSHQADDSNAYYFFLLTLIILFTLPHCFFFVLPRYAFPIVPLFLISIASLLQSYLPQVLRKKASRPDPRR